MGGALADCELIGESFLGQPANAISTLAFVVAGVVIARRPDVRWIGIATAATGLGSFLFHGPMAPGADWVHDTTLLWLLLVIVGWGRRWEPWTHLPGLAVVAVILAGVPVVADPVAIALTAVAIGLFFYSNRNIGTWGPLSLLALAAVIGRLGATGGPLCEPESIWQPHALWHVSAAAAVAWFALARPEPSHARQNAGMPQPVGDAVPTQPRPPHLTRAPLRGENVQLRTPDPERDAANLYPPTHGSETGEAVWTYMGYGPFSDLEAMEGWIGERGSSPDPLWFTVADSDDVAIGMAAMMNADPEHRRLELGHIWYVPDVHRTGANTEAAYLMLKKAFGTYRCRRVEWKCDSLNAPSRHAALRLGFSFEGVFRNHMIVKGRNRDTAWYAMTDADWDWVRPALEEWLVKPEPKPSLSALMLSRGS